MKVQLHIFCLLNPLLFVEWFARQFTYEQQTEDSSVRAMRALGDLTAPSNLLWVLPTP